MRLLIVVDMQNAFVTGSSQFESIKAIIPRIQDKIYEYRHNRDDVVFTRDVYYEDSSQEFDIIPELDVRRREVFVKDHYGLSIELLEDLEDYSFYGYLDKYESIEIVGVMTNLCVLSTAISIQSNIYDCGLIIDASCCAAPDEELHNKALDIMDALKMNIINR